MSDFLTRLIERQTANVAMVQPRIPSMFAPPANRTATVGPPVSGSLLPLDEASRTSAAALRPSDHGREVPIKVDQQDRQPPIPGSRSTPRVGEARRTESVPAPLIRNASTVGNRPVHPVPTAPRIRSEIMHEQARRQQTDLSGLHVEDRDASAPVPLALRIESPPRLVEAHHDMVRSAAAAPPSLASGAVMGRRTEPTHAVPPEAPVEVTIGRIEVTAVSSAPDQKRKSTSRRPAMSLEEYLTRRQGGRP